MVDDDRNHAEALKTWGKLGKALVPTVVIFELAYFLVTYGLDLEIITKIVTNPKVELVSNNLDDILFLSRHPEEVKQYDDVGDQTVLSVAMKMGIELETFDHDLKKRAAKADSGV